MQDGSREMREIMQPEGEVGHLAKRTRRVSRKGEKV